MKPVYYFVLSLFVLQKVCVLQYSSDSVRKPVGPNNDVQKYDTVAVLEVLLGYVPLHCLNCIIVIAAVVSRI